MKLQLLFLSLLVSGSQASGMYHGIRIISDWFGHDAVGEHEDAIAMDTDCVLPSDRQTCMFPMINFGTDNITLQIRNEEIKSSRNQTAVASLRSGKGDKEVNPPYEPIACIKVQTNIEGVFHYECEGAAREANFIQIEDETGTERMYGTIHIGSDVCRVVPNSGDDTHEITCTPEADFDDEEEVEDEEDGEEDQAQRQLRIEEKFGHVKLGIESGATEGVGEARFSDVGGAEIDLMVVWTKKSECMNANLPPTCVPSQATETQMRALITLALQETNVAFELSGVKSTLRLVHAYRHEEYEEPTSRTFSRILSDVTNVDDGELEDVHAKRILYGADLVHVIAGSRGACGIGHVGPRIAMMFSVSRYDCSVGRYTFAHEIGHNLGARHDRGARKKCSADTEYSFGFKDPNAEFRSIMASDCYSRSCGNVPREYCPRVQRFSNTDVLYLGKEIGDEANNNVRRINENIRTVAGHYPSMNCMADSDCNDNNSSTIDTCEGQGVCVFKPRPSMESVAVANVASLSWKVVTLSRNYVSPVIACTVKYGNTHGMKPAVVRMMNVKSDSFSIRIQEPGSSFLLGSRDVHCLVVEKGSWTLPDGRKVEAQTYESKVSDSKSGGWIGEKRTLNHVFEQPVVVGQVMSSNDPKWSTFWARGEDHQTDLDGTQLWTGKHTGEDPNNVRSPETIGFIVIESGHGTSSSVEIEAARGGPQVVGYTQFEQLYTFESPFVKAPEVIVVSGLQMTDTDGFWPVLTSDATSSSFGIAVDEDQMSDKEREHFPEALSYVAFSSQGPILLNK